MTELTEYKMEQDVLKKKLGQDYYTKLNLVFPRQDGYFTDSGTFLDVFSRIQNKLDIPHRNVHAMRHTFATRALENGMKTIVVSRLLGHASIQITMDIYGHVIPDFAEQELEKMEEMYVSLYNFKFCWFKFRNFIIKNYFVFINFSYIIF